MSDKQTKKGSLIKKIAMGFLATFGIGVAAVSIFIMVILINTPDINPKNMVFAENSIIYDSNNKVTEKIQRSESRYVVKDINNIPANFKNAVLAIEDHTFYDHHGINIKRTLGAFVKNIKSGYKAQGASTITQQLAKNLYLTNEKTYKRKIKELFYSLQLERELNKNQILLAYLNTMSLGQGNRGVQAACHNYFDKDVSDLTLAESALLAGITKYPSKYAAYKTTQLTKDDDLKNVEIIIYAQDYVPTDDDLDIYETLLENDRIDRLTYDALKKGRKVIYKAEFNPKSKQRQEVVLRRMLELGYITRSEYNDAIKEDIKINIGEDVESKNSSYFNSLVKKDVVKALVKEGYTEDEAKDMLYNGGLRIYSTIDSNMQNILEREYERGAHFPSTYRDDNGILQPQSAMVIMGNDNGQIKAMIGGRGIGGESLYNRAINPRQPGSSIKPLAVYMPLMEREGLTPYSILNDSPIKKLNGKDWPSNAGGSYHGGVTMAQAVKQSYNGAAVHGAAMLGNGESDSMKVVLDSLKNVGITTIDDIRDRKYPAVLGGMDRGVSPLEMTAAYAAIANGGVYVEPITFTKIELSDGSLLVDNKPKTKRVYSKSTAYYMTQMLQGVVNSGTGQSARLSNMAVAGKTGTTNGNKDAWFCGYTPYYTASVWIGNDRIKDGYRDTSIPQGSKISATLWRYVMGSIHEKLEGRDFGINGSVIREHINYSQPENNTPEQQGEQPQQPQQEQPQGEQPVPQEQPVQPQVPQEPQPQPTPQPAPQPVPQPEQPAQPTEPTQPQ